MYLIMFSLVLVQNSVIYIKKNPSESKKTFFLYLVVPREGFPDQRPVPSARQHRGLPQIDQGLRRTCFGFPLSTQRHRIRKHLTYDFLHYDCIQIYRSSFCSKQIINLHDSLPIFLYHCCLSMCFFLVYCHCHFCRHHRGFQQIARAN